MVYIGSKVKVRRGLKIFGCNCSFKKSMFLEKKRTILYIKFENWEEERAPTVPPGSYVTGCIYIQSFDSNIYKAC